MLRWGVAGAVAHLVPTRGIARATGVVDGSVKAEGISPSSLQTLGSNVVAASATGFVWVSHSCPRHVSTSYAS